MSLSNKRSLLSTLSVAGLLLLSGCVEPANGAPGTTSAGPRPKGRFVLHSSGLPDIGMWKCHPLLVDLNHDGRLDLVAISRKAPGLRVWLGSANGKWAESKVPQPTNFTCGGGVVAGDINRDGHLDLVVADHCYGISLILGDGAGGWKSGGFGPRIPNSEYKKDPSAMEFVGTEDLAIGDFDKDGVLDLVFGASEFGGIRAFRGSQGGSSWTESSNGLPQKGLANTVVLTDVNKDGALDIVAAYEEGPRVYVGDGHGKWSEKSSGLSSPTVGGLFYAVAVGDINEDGRPDIVAANWVDGVETFFQNADGTWDKRPDVFPDLKGGAQGIGLGDVNGDHHLDIVLTGRGKLANGPVYGIYVLFGNGHGEFTVHHGELPDSGLDTSWGVAFGDVNKDGIDDFVAAIGGFVPVDATVRPSPITEKMQVWCWEPAR